jgi:hypothetical protein
MKELLKYLCRFPYEESYGEQMKTLLQEVDDWEKAVKLINNHGIIALAAYNIISSGLKEYVPVKCMKVLENGLKMNIARNAWLTERWKEVNRVLSEAGIRHVLLKGMNLEYSVYGGMGLRQMNDNDILIKKGEALQAWKLLKSNGFESEIIKSPLHKKIHPYLRMHLPALTKDNYTIEIHNRIFLGTDVTDEMVESAKTIEIDGVPAYIPDLKLNKKFLLLHLEKHRRNGEYPIRLYADLEIIEPGSAPEISDEFIFNPVQHRSTSIKNIRSTLNLLPLRLWPYYIIGELFPSPKWMKQNYSCSFLKLFLLYPARIFSIAASIT